MEAYDIDGEEVDSNPLSYDVANRIFTAESNEENLIGKILTITVKAEFINYPEITNPTVSTA